MRLINIQNGKQVEGEILEIEKTDFSKIKSSIQFHFDWHKEATHKIFKLIVNNEILGLISTIDYPEEFRIHINLIEVAINQRGKTKEVDGIAGCLMAKAAQIAFEKNYSGFVSLVPKTALITLYTKKYFFQQFGRQLGLTPKNASSLINKYLNYEEE